MWPFIAAAIVSIVNGMLKHHQGSKGLKKALNVLLDLLSVTTRKDSACTLKMPLRQSKAPPTKEPMTI